VALSRISDDLFAEAIATRDRGDVDGAIALLVRSIELNPAGVSFRAELDRLLGTLPARRDLTSECLIFPMRHVPTHSTARPFGPASSSWPMAASAATYSNSACRPAGPRGASPRLMRDLGSFGDLHLFDSFQGLPRSKHAIDRASYDVKRGIWQAEMKPPDAWVEEIGAPIDLHVAQSLARVISPSRIHVRRGFFAETLREPLAT
jgi:hypothetical protein